MTTQSSDWTTNSHPDDGVLLALLDREREDLLDETRDAALDAGRRHLERCDDCRARLAAVAARSSQVREALAAIPVPRVTADEFRRRLDAGTARRLVPRGRRPLWQAAAAVLVVAGAAAAATGSIRAWLRHRTERQAVEQRAAVQPPRAVMPHVADRSGATVSFAVTGADFTVRFDSLPAAGILTVDSTTSSELSARVSSGAGTGGDAMVVLPGELLVRNSSASRASYDIAVPAAVTRLRVIVAGRAVFDGAPRIVLGLHPNR